MTYEQLNPCLGNSCKRVIDHGTRIFVNYLNYTQVQTSYSFTGEIDPLTTFNIMYQHDIIRTICVNKINKKVLLNRKINPIPKYTLGPIIPHVYNFIGLTFTICV